MGKYIYPQDGLPEMEYDEPKKEKHCRNCRNSAITNPGAVTPGLECKIMAMLFKKKKIENGMDQVDGWFGSCKFHNMTLKAIKQALQAEAQQ